MHVIAHHRIRINAARENLAQFLYALFQPRLAVIKVLLCVVINAAQPRAPHAARHAVIAASVVRIDELFARLSHGLRVATPSGDRYQRDPMAV